MELFNKCSENKNCFYWRTGKQPTCKNCKYFNTDSQYIISDFHHCTKFDKPVSSKFSCDTLELK